MKKMICINKACFIVYPISLVGIWGMAMDTFIIKEESSIESTLAFYGIMLYLTIFPIWFFRKVPLCIIEKGKALTMYYETFRKRVIGFNEIVAFNYPVTTGKRITYNIITKDKEIIQLEDDYSNLKSICFKWNMEYRGEEYRKSMVSKYADNGEHYSFSTRWTEACFGLQTIMLVLLLVIPFFKIATEKPMSTAAFILAVMLAGGVYLWLYTLTSFSVKAGTFIARNHFTKNNNLAIELSRVAWIHIGRYRINIMMADGKAHGISHKLSSSQIEDFKRKLQGLGITCL